MVIIFDKVIIHYFSGTGNTLHMINLIEEYLKNEGYFVKCNNIEQNNFNNLENNTLNIFSYPIYGFGTPSLVLRYIKKLPKAYNCKATIICTCTEFESQSLQHTSLLLKKTGYNISFADIVLYPQNWTQIVNPYNNSIHNRMFEAGDKRVLSLIDDITKNKRKFIKRNPSNLIWSWIIFFLFSHFGRRILGKCFITDNSCTLCQKCVKDCPVNSIYVSKKTINWAWNCENCQRCINSCPTQAIQTSLLKLILFILPYFSQLFAVIIFNRYYSINLLANIILYLFLIFLTTIFTEIIVSYLLKIPLIRKLLQFSYTKNYRRYKV